MKRTILNALKAFGVLGFLATCSLLAQQDHRIIVTVPFDFLVANQHLDAGTYSVTTNLSAGAVLIRAENNASAKFVLVHPTEPAKTPVHPKLVFDRYGERYFLSQVWPADMEQGSQLPASKAEQELARNMGKPAIVSLLASGSGTHKPAR